MRPPAIPVSTGPREPADASRRAERATRLLAIVVMAGLVVAAVLGFLGVRSRTVSATGRDLALEVHYAQFARAGLAVPFDVTIRSRTGAALPTELRVELSSHYLAMFDENGIAPEPDASWGSTGRVVWVFDVPPGESELAIALDVRLSPSVQLSRRRGEVVVFANGQQAVSASVTTWVLP